MDKASLIGLGSCEHFQAGLADHHLDDKMCDFSADIGDWSSQIGCVKIIVEFSVGAQ